MEDVRRIISKLYVECISSAEERTEEERERNKRYDVMVLLVIIGDTLNFVSELSRQNEIAKKNLEKIQAQLKSTDAELTALKKVAVKWHAS